jgi:hypothetical protein
VVSTLGLVLVLLTPAPLLLECDVTMQATLILIKTPLELRDLLLQRTALYVKRVALCFVMLYKVTKADLQMNIALQLDARFLVLRYGLVPLHKRAAKWGRRVAARPFLLCLYQW